MPELVTCDDIDIRDVWDHNLEREFSLLRDIVDQYPYIAMDTEFPGVVIRRVVSYVIHFEDLKDNVDMLKLIQLGLTFSDENGNLPTCGGDKPCIWQFNFREFDIKNDDYAPDSINLLKRSGIDFEKNNEMGVDCKRFAELLMSSGIVLNDDVHWVAFHCPYDFAYLLKALTCQCLPDSVAGFFHLINIFFPIIYDVKYMIKFCNGLYGGLDKLAELLEIKRIGTSHQAGSDTLLTLRTFMKLKADFFNGSVEKYAGFLYGLAIEND